MNDVDIENLEPDDADRSIDAAWIEEIEARAEAIDRGEAKTFDGQSSLDEIRRQLRAGR
jgi:hypothetical protein